MNVTDETMALLREMIADRAAEEAAAVKDRVEASYLAKFFSEGQEASEPLQEAPPIAQTAMAVTRTPHQATVKELADGIYAAIVDGKEEKEAIMTACGLPMPRAKKPKGAWTALWKEALAVARKKYDDIGKDGDRNNTRWFSKKAELAYLTAPMTPVTSVEAAWSTWTAEQQAKALAAVNGMLGNKAAS